MKLVSIIIPVHNGELYICQCIDSLLLQSYRNLEIILVDDGSTDKTLEKCQKKYSCEDSVKIICQDNMGVSEARNAGIKFAKGTYIMFCDADDILCRETASIMVNSIERNHVELAVCGFQSFEKEDNIEDNPKNGWKSEILNRNESMKFVLTEKKYSGYVWNKIFKRSLIKDGKFKEPLAVLEDQLFVCEYINNIHSSVYVKSDLYCYRSNPLGALRQNLNERKLTAVDARYEIYALIRKNGYSEDLCCIAWNDLLRTCVDYYYKLMFVREEYTTKWKDKIKTIIREEHNKFALDRRWSRKLKVLYNILIHF